MESLDKFVTCNLKNIVEYLREKSNKLTRNSLYIFKRVRR